MKPIHAFWLVEMYNFLSLYLSQGLVNFVKEKDFVSGIVYHPKREIKVTWNMKFSKNRKIYSVAKYSNLNIAKLTWYVFQSK